MPNLHPDISGHSDDYQDDNHHSVKSLRAEEPSQPVTENNPQESKENTSGNEDADKEAVVIPRGKRRGLLSRFCLIRELNDARLHKSGEKNVIVLLIAFAALIGPMGTSIFLPAMDDVAKALNTSKDIVNVTYGVYVLSMGIFPLWWSGFSEVNGRRSVYVVSFTLFICFTVGAAVCKNVTSLAILRVISGGCAASVQAVGAGTIADIFIPQQRGRAMGYFYLGPLCGPLLSPIIGGAITAKWGWRSTMWFMVFIGAASLLTIIFFLPETLRTENPKGLIENSNDPALNADLMAPLAPRTVSYTSQTSGYSPDHDERFLAKIYQTFAKQMKKEKTSQTPESWQHTLKVVFVDPLKGLKLLRYPPVPLTIIYSGYSFMVLYFINIGVENLYSSAPYNWGSILVGLCYIPNSVGYILSSIGNGYFSDHLIRKSIKKNGRVIPEDRLGVNLYFAAILLPCSLVAFGWCAKYQIFWVFPLIATFLFGIASMLTFGNVATYLVDALPGKGSTGIALNNLVRMVLAAVASFVASPLQNAMGYGWLYTMLAIGSVMSFGAIVALKLKGAHYRETYDVTSFY